MTTAFVEVTYRGLRVGEKVKLTEGDAGIFLESETPMPVGTALVLRGEGGERRARVAAVVEHEAGAGGQPPGMRLVWDTGEVAAGTAGHVPKDVQVEPEAPAAKAADASGDGGGGDVDASGDGSPAEPTEGDEEPAASTSGSLPVNGTTAGTSSGGGKKTKKNKKRR